MATARDQFLTAHPAFARLLAGPDPVALRRWLRDHPDIGTAWNQLTTPAAAPRPAAATPGGAAPAGAAGSAPVTTPLAPAAASAKAAITDALSSYGLGSLGSWAWQQYLNGSPPEQIMLDLRGTTEYKARFPGMAVLSAAGHAINESTYIEAERSYQSQMRAYGLPESFYDAPDDFSKLIAGNVSAQEFGDRLQMAQTTALASPQGQRMRDELTRLYGIPNAIGAVTAYWLDPDKAADIIKRQFTAGQIASESLSTGFGSLTLSQAERITDAGTTVDQARQGFGQLATMDEFRQGLVGDSGDTGVSQDTMVDAAFTGDAAAAKKVAGVARRRTAAFEGGGGYSAGQGGISGLGSASS